MGTTGLMLPARSLAEARLYIELHPCGCGERRLEHRHRWTDAGALIAGPCPACGAARTFEFALPDLPPRGGDFGGAEPSAIVGADEFLAASDRAADSAPAVPPDDRAARLTAAAALELAVRALEEVLKFVPAGESRVPIAALRSAAGKEAYLRDPAGLSRDRLAARLSAYRDLLSIYRRAG